MCDIDTVRLMDRGGRPIPRPTATMATWEWPRDQSKWPANAHSCIPRDWMIVWENRHGENGWWTWPTS